jgi:uncharacterized protein (DUF427 family)
MARATWNGTTIVESDDVVEVEGNLYFPLADVAPDVLEPTGTTSLCPWKGRAGYFSVLAGDGRNEDAAWTYPHPLPGARHVADRVAFWKGVEVSR